MLYSCGCWSVVRTSSSRICHPFSHCHVVAKNERFQLRDAALEIVAAERKVETSLNLGLRSCFSTLGIRISAAMAVCLAECDGRAIDESRSDARVSELSNSLYVSITVLFDDAACTHIDIQFQ